MGFSRIRKLLRREASKEVVFLKLTRGLNLERDYQRWIKDWETYKPGDAAPIAEISLVIAVLGEGTESDNAFWSSLAKQRRESVQIIRVPGPIAQLHASNTVASATADYIALVHASDRIAVSALRHLQPALEAFPKASVIYGDEDQIDVTGRRFAPWFKPDFGDDLFLSQHGLGRAVIFRSSALAQIALPRTADLDLAIYHMALEMILASGEEPLHCPGILVHVAGDPAKTPKCRHLYLDNAGRRPVVESYVARRPPLAGATVDGPDARGFLHLRHALPADPPLVSIIIPTRDRKDLLERCVDSLDRLTTYRKREIIILDNDSREAATKAYFSVLSKRSDVRIVPAPGPFNYSRLINRGATLARGEILATLNNDIEVINPDWLQEMVSQALRPGVGVVGCLLLYPDGSIQHAGVIVGLGGVAGRIFGGAPAEDVGYAGRIRVAQDLSAVTGACQVMRRAVFERLGGLDETLAVAYNDVDFCLRARKAGLRVIYTPSARLLHHHSASRGSDKTPERLASYMWEREHMRSRWSRLILDDPFFNPNLSLSGKKGRLATAPRTRIFKS